MFHCVKTNPRGTGSPYDLTVMSKEALPPSQPDSSYYTMSASGVVQVRLYSRNRSRNRNRNPSRKRIGRRVGVGRGALWQFAARVAVRCARVPFACPAQTPPAARRVCGLDAHGTSAQPLHAWGAWGSLSY
jgi:hypothetical protein